MISALSPTFGGLFSHLDLFYLFSNVFATSIDVLGAKISFVVAARTSSSNFNLLKKGFFLFFYILIWSSSNKSGVPGNVPIGFLPK